MSKKTIKNIIGKIDEKIKDGKQSFALQPFRDFDHMNKSIFTGVKEYLDKQDFYNLTLARDPTMKEIWFIACGKEVPKVWEVFCTMCHVIISFNQHTIGMEQGIAAAQNYFIQTLSVIENMRRDTMKEHGLILPHYVHKHIPSESAARALYELL